MAGKNDGKIRCSFCGKTQDQVNRLISGPNGAFICDECIDICAEILEEEGVEGHEDKSSAKDDINLVTPEELKAFFGRLCNRTGPGKEGAFGCCLQSL